MAKSLISNEELKEVRDNLLKSNNKVTAWMIRDKINMSKNVHLDESTIRGRFCEMKEPLGGIGRNGGQRGWIVDNLNGNKVKLKNKPVVMKPTVTPVKKHDIINELQSLVPKDDMFKTYIERPIDNRLAVHYDSGHHPLTSGKQGTGKTTAHHYYAFKRKLPIFEMTCNKEFELRKQFGGKTIVNQNIIFEENLLAKIVQGPGVVLFDEINYVTNENSVEFHGMLVQRELYIKDADKIYKLHPECKIGFAQNPKSAKYLGSNVKPSNFLGRCSYLTFPDFSKQEITEALVKRFPKVHGDMLRKFAEFYFAVCDKIERSKLPIDISIRQLNAMVELWKAGLPLNEAIEDGLSGMCDAASQPDAKQSFMVVAHAIWTDTSQKHNRT